MYDPVWDRIFSSRSWGRYPAEELIRFVAREAFSVADRSTLKGLELGCGPGANLWFLANEGIPFDAIDGSKSAVAQAKARLDHEKPGWKGRIEVGNFHRLPEDFRAYNFVLDSEAIYCNDFDESSRREGRSGLGHLRLAPGASKAGRALDRTTGSLMKGLWQVKALCASRPCSPCRNCTVPIGLQSRSGKLRVTTAIQITLSENGLL
jgi:hypothetical protein